jgi:mono/diheme cytochrome c family protein
LTEIPEHLLRRSRERRAALSGAEGAEGEAATEQAAAVTAETPAAAAPVLAGAPAPATQAGGGGSTAGRGQRPAPAEAEPLPRLPPTRPKTPFWILPVLVALPIWGIVYLGAFGNRTKANVNDPVVAGATLFTNNCATCHGANGEGGVGPQLNGGQVLKVWPKLADHINWVHTGGEPYIGKTIGAINIPVPANNVMPAFGMDHGGPLTNQQIQDVVCYERVTFGGAPENALNCPKTA